MLAPDAVVAFVDAEAQPHVGVDRVEPFVLELVGFDLVAEADAASLLAEVNDGALALLFDHAHRFVELCRRSRSGTSRRCRPWRTTSARVISTGSSSVHSPLVSATCSSPLLF